MVKFYNKQGKTFARIIIGPFKPAMKTNQAKYSKLIQHNQLCISLFKNEKY